MVITNEKSRKILGTALIVFGLFLVVYFLIWSTGILLWSFDVAVLFILLLGLLLILIGAMMRQGKSILFLIKNKPLRVLIRLTFVIFIFSFIVIEGLVIYDGFVSDENVYADFILIPGAEVVNDRPSRVLLHRLERALDYIRNNPNTLIIVSGSKSPEDTLSEAQVMENYLVEHDISKTRIIKEEKAKDSYQNIKFSIELIPNYSISNNSDIKMMFVTNNYHLFRMRAIASSLGIEAYGIPVPIHYSVVPICFSREYFSVIKYFLFN